MNALIREISLLLPLVLAGISELSGASAHATEPLLKGSASEKLLRPLFVSDLHRPTYRPSIRSKSGAARHACFLVTLFEAKTLFLGTKLPDSRW